MGLYMEILSKGWIVCLISSDANRIRTPCLMDACLPKTTADGAQSFYMRLKSGIFFPRAACGHSGCLKGRGENGFREWGGERMRISLSLKCASAEVAVEFAL